MAETPKRDIPKAIDLIYSEIGLYIKNLGAKWDYNKDTRFGWERVRVNGVGVDLVVTEDWSGHGYFMHHTGKLRVKFRANHQTHQFPERKAGIDYAKIAKLVVEHANSKLTDLKHAEEISARAEKTEKVVKQINSDLGLNGYHIRAETNKLGNLMIRIESECDEPSARNLLDLAKRLLKNEK